MTIERGTPFFGLLQQGQLTQLNENQAADMYEATQERLYDAGLPAYEISNHAAPGAECRHNLLYWHYGNYAGIGPGAHARLKKDNQKYAVERRKLPERWLQMVETEGHGTRKAEALDPNSYRRPGLHRDKIEREAEAARRRGDGVGAGASHRNRDGRALGRLADEGRFASSTTQSMDHVRR